MVPEEQLAPIERRILSFLVDEVVVSLLFVTIYAEQISGLGSPDAVQDFLQFNLWALITLKLLYHSFFIGYNGMTLGKYLAKIRAVDLWTGELIGYPRALLRAGVRILDESFFYIGFLPAFFLTTRQTLHDQISECVVVHA